METLEHWIAALLGPLAVWILVSGLDDLVLNVAWFRSLFASRWRAPRPSEVRAVRQKRIAIFVPLWHEAEVIGKMLARNLASIDYERYDIFVGAYPNDEPTLDAVRRVEERSRRVHLAICPHNGPTSKADCLNWIYQRMLLYEEDRRVRFEIIMTHDAEDLIHPDSLAWINYYTGTYDMVQIPVLPLRTPAWHWTHALYCDEFAEYQTKDLPVRMLLGGFIPSNGVGTGYRREAMELLAEKSSNRIFEPSCLTEDYENGLRLHQLGCKQVFVPVGLLRGEPLATREFFPQKFRQAVRQRTRWVTGIALQSWERNGWNVGPRQWYWLWRDRKGLLGNPASLLTNLITLYGTATLVAARVTGTYWTLGSMVPDSAAYVFWLSQVLQFLTLATRCVAVKRLYGFWMAAGSPFRVFYANLINTLATGAALRRFWAARLGGEPLVWLKTEHSYPSLASLSEANASIPAEEVEALVAEAEAEPVSTIPAPPAAPPRIQAPSQPPLLQQDWAGLTGLPLSVARALPATVIRDWRVLPFKVENGCLYIAAAEPPSDEIRQRLREFTRLELRVQLIPRANFEEARAMALGEAAGAAR